MSGGTDYERDDQVRQIVDAFNTAFRASVTTLATADTRTVANMKPAEFARTYCNSPMRVLSMDIESLELRKERELQFYSLDERSLQFLPIGELVEVAKPNARLQAIVMLRSPLLVYNFMSIFYVTPNREVLLEDSKIIDVRPTENNHDSDSVFIETVKSYVPYIEGISGQVIVSIIVQALKKLLGL